jgi:hypothetical protein
MEYRKENPYGANGTTSDPREQIMWDNYVKSIAEGKENAYKSAIDAGYEESNAKNITMREWFKERLRKLKRKEMLSKAERNLDEMLDLDTYDEKGKNNPQLLNIKKDVSVTIAKTLGKDDGYSEKKEIDHTTLGEKITGINYIQPNGDND